MRGFWVLVLALGLAGSAAAQGRDGLGAAQPLRAASQNSNESSWLRAGLARVQPVQK